MPGSRCPRTVRTSSPLGVVQKGEGGGVVDSTRYSLFLSPKEAETVQRRLSLPCNELVTDSLYVLTDSEIIRGGHRPRGLLI